jgi:hypothetical protein
MGDLQLEKKITSAFALALIRLSQGFPQSITVQGQLGDYQSF